MRKNRNSNQNTNHTYPRPTKEAMDESLHHSKFIFTPHKAVELFYKKRQAIEYLTWGYSIFPLMPGDKRPGVKWEKLQTQYIKRDEWREWWGEHPDSNIAIITGELSGVDVIDADSPEGRNAIEDQLPVGLKTHIVKTPKGWHYYFKHTAGVRNKNRFITDCDVRGEGGYVVAPHSTVNGHTYRWLPGHTPEDAPLEEIPEVLLEKILEGNGKEKGKKKESVDPIKVLDGVSEGERDTTLFRYACRLQRQGLKKEEITALVLQAAKNCDPPFPDEEARNNAIAQALKYEQPIDREMWFELLNDQYAVIQAGGKVTVMKEVMDETFDTPRPNIILFKSKGDFFTLYSNKRIQAGKKEISVAQYWIDHPDRRTFEGIIFEPEKQIPGKYNLWTGFGVEPRQGDWSLMREHIFENICSSKTEWFDYLMDWLAYIVQKPGGERPGVSIVLRGKQGTGKGCFASTFGEIFGSHYLHITNQGHFVGRFNSHQRNCILGFIDEALWSGDKNAVGTVKSIITESHIMSEQKFQDAMMIRNHMNLIFSSNQNWIIPAGLEERRFFVLDVSDKHMQDTDYFGKVFRQMREQGGKEAMLYDLLRRGVNFRRLMMAPKTEALFEQKLRSMSSIELWWDEVLNDGKIGEMDWNDDIPTADLYESYHDHTEKQKDWHPLPNRVFGIELKKLCQGLRIWKPTIQGKQVRCYALPSLERCRKKWDERTVHTTTWDEENMIDDDR